MNIDHPKGSSWFIPGETEKELSALEVALKEAKAVGATKVRIQFL